VLRRGEELVFRIDDIIALELFCQWLQQCTVFVGGGGGDVVVTV
jgi:hypothetical protein